MDSKPCLICGGPLEVINKPYHYNECGLDNVVLIGIHQFYCKSCDETFVSLPHIEVLHRAIGKILCCEKTALLNANEIKFLRKELQLKSKELAKALGVTPETVSRWENNKSPISESEDRLLRSLYMMFVSEQAEKVLHRGVLKLFAALPQKRKMAVRGRKIELSAVDWMDNQQPQFCAS